MMWVVDCVVDGDLLVEGMLFLFVGVISWFNSLLLDGLLLCGKVVLVDFWIYFCINCLCVLFYVCEWVECYCNYGLVVIGVYVLEFVFECNFGNV